MKLGGVDFVKLAEANGCDGVRVDSVVGLRRAIGSREARRPLLIEVPLRYPDINEFQISF